PRRAADAWLQRDGPLTRELLRAPGAFGLGQVPARLAPEATARLICGYCSTGCALTAHLQGGEAVNLSPDPDYPVNLGMACPKGWEALAPLDAPDRATRPLVRNAAGVLEPVPWPVALRTFVERFRAVEARHGPEAMAFLSTGQIPTEEMVALGTLAKFGMGMIHGDGNTRQCMATAAVAYKEAFGFDAPPYTYADFEASDVLVFVGSNPCIAHPILWERVCRNPHSPEIVVVDPRKTETAMAATAHYAIQPKSDLAFFYGVAQVLVERGWIDRDYVEHHTAGYAAFAEFLGDYAPERVASQCGVGASEIERLAETIHAGERVSFWWTMGVNQSHEAVRVAQALINTALMTGNMGRPGTGANSITGQCNAMGSRLFSNTTNLLGGHDFANPAHREKVAGVLGIDAALIPDTASDSYDQILAGVREGRIKGLWIVATNSAHSWIHQNELRRTLAQLDCLVVQDLYATTETAQLADVFLPAAGWGEKEGTFINSERRIGRVRKVKRAPGQALADFHIFSLVAKAWGCDLFPTWKAPEDVFTVLKELTRGQPCDITGIRDYRALEEAGGIQWPLREGETLASHERRLFEDGAYAHPDGRARFCFEAPRPPEEAPDADYPLVLLTGRGTSSQWHTETRTGKSAVLRKLAPAGPVFEVHPDDARAAGLRGGDFARLVSRRGEMRARAVVTPNVAAGQVFVPMHDAATNQLTYPAFDPYSRQPSYKYAAIRLEPASDPSSKP
ncbi:MAG: nitrate reductase, partial [Proteobacteria bacterium]|nr:nitrate reductase [Pseudomonadota bacterium]